MMKPGAEVEALRQDIAEMERMLDEYLDFARGEDGAKAELADLGALLRDVTDAATRIQPAGRGQITLDAPDGIQLAVKRNALRRCVANLIDNALKHGTRVHILLVREGRTTEIRVDDDGPGIPEDKREEAFRPFHRLDGNLQTGGVGLGLTIARDIARAHGGDLVLSQSPEGGLRATIKLPV